MFVYVVGETLSVRRPSARGASIKHIKQARIDNSPSITYYSGYRFPYTCMYIYIYIYIHTHICIYIYIYIMYLSLSIYIYIYVYMYIYIYIYHTGHPRGVHPDALGAQGHPDDRHPSGEDLTHIYIYIYINTSVYIYICIYIYI